jgi:tetratricopeptide (TPR) repeat protein
MADTNAQDLVEEATFEFTVGNHDRAIALLAEAIALDADCFSAWLAKAEVHFDQRALDEALDAGEKALALAPDDVLANTTLSRIWMERGEKEKAEHYGAQARLKGWKAELKGDSDGD